VRPPNPERLGLSAAGDGDREERAYRATALLGIRSANAPILVLEPRGEIARLMAELLPEVHLVLAAADEPRSAGRAGTLSRLRVGARIPFQDRCFRGVAVLGTPSPELLSEAVRLLAPGARLMVEAAAVDTAETLRGAGLEVVLQQDAVVVAIVAGPG
jgi:hypothetical protein